MKKILSIISGITLISILPFSTTACSVEVKINEYKSDPGFESNGQLFNDNKEVMINFDYPDGTFHHLEIKANINAKTFEKVKEFYGFAKDNTLKIEKMISHIKYDYQLKHYKNSENENVNIEIVNNVYILQ